jgi:hypothetical protein
VPWIGSKTIAVRWSACAKACDARGINLFPKDACTRVQQAFEAFGLHVGCGAAWILVCVFAIFLGVRFPKLGCWVLFGHFTPFEGGALRDVNPAQGERGLRFIHCFEVEV